MTIVLRSLVVRSGSTTLVNGVSLRLAPASRTALVGASGAGNSLTSAALAGTHPASLEVAGSLTIEPDDVDAGSDSRASSAPGGEASREGLRRRAQTTRRAPTAQWGGARLVGGSGPQPSRAWRRSIGVETASRARTTASSSGAS